MKINGTNKAFNKPLVNYGDVVFRREDIEIGSLLDGDAFSGNESGGNSNTEDTTNTNTNTEDNQNTNTNVNQEDNNQEDNQNTNTEQNTDTEQGTNTEQAVDLTDEEFKAELLEKYKGTDVDEEGNIVDDKGEIIKKVDEIEEYASDEVPFINEIQTTLGYEILGEDGAPVQYEDTTEGIAQYVSDSAGQQATSQINKFLDTFPELTDLHNHLATGGNVNNFYATEQDWSNTELDKSNKSQLRSVIKEDFLSKGMDEGTIDTMLDTFDDTGKLFEMSKVSKQARIDTKLETARVNQQKVDKQKEDRQNNIVAHWNEIKTVVTNGKLKNINIPKAEQDDFYNYVSKAVDSNGNSQDMVDRQKEDKETTLMMSFWRYKGYDLNKLVKSMVAQEKATSMRQRITKNVPKHKRNVIKKPISGAQNTDININNFQ